MPNSQIAAKDHFARLKAGRERFSHIPGYTATLVKQERIGDWLSDEASFGVKVRHQPFSVFMKWQSGDDTGKEVLYVDGVDDGQLLVRLGGLKGRILPALKIDPFGSLALQHSRYPITKLGILALTDTLIERRELEMHDGIVPRVEQKPDADCDGRTLLGLHLRGRTTAAAVARLSQVGAVHRPPVECPASRGQLHVARTGPASGRIGPRRGDAHRVLHVLGCRRRCSTDRRRL